jgi:hypothetical protein
MNRALLELALDSLDASHWRRFEVFASGFMVDEFESYKSTASSGGDGGRDGTLLIDGDEERTALQYSVTANWTGKIKKTAERLSESFPSVQQLIYATNHEIGALADSVAKLLRDDRTMFLDVRDRNWFCDRWSTTDQRQQVTEELVREIVDPLLEGRELIRSKAKALSTEELQCAFVFVGMQLADDSRDKGLTRLSYEAVVRAALWDTNSESRLVSAEVIRRVKDMIPAQDDLRVAQSATAALGRLVGQSVRHFPASDEYCLSHEEVMRLKERLASAELDDKQLDKAIGDVVMQMAKSLQWRPEQQLQPVAGRVRRVVEQFLVSRGESFVKAVSTGEFAHLDLGDLRHVVANDFGRDPDSYGLRGTAIDLVYRASRELLVRPPEPAQMRLRRLADSYTLMSFLQTTPDIQSVVRGMFKDADVWLDTTILLPLFSECLVSPERRQFTQMIRSARAVGIRLYFTDGVLEELLSHMNRSATCAAMPARHWEGSIPYLFGFYLEAGIDAATFGTWLNEFRGSSRPEDDLTEFLEDEFGISRQSLEDDYEGAPFDLRVAVDECWMEVHERRRKADTGDQIGKKRLASHDAENYLGVLQRRRGQSSAPFGYTTWWLSTDRHAFTIGADIADRLGRPHETPPVLSIDYLANYLSFGPHRMEVGDSGHRLPLVFDLGVTDYLTPEILEKAEHIRGAAADMSDRVQRRRVRDYFDSARSEPGEMTRAGLPSADEYK